jgi:hypothetical protein
VCCRLYIGQESCGRDEKGMWAHGDVVTTGRELGGMKVKT